MLMKFKTHILKIIKNKLKLEIYKSPKDFESPKPFQPDWFKNSYSFSHYHQKKDDLSLSCILDIGCNDGSDSLLYAIHNPKIDVFAFDPVPEMINKIKINKIKMEGKINKKISNFYFFPYGISTSEGKRKFGVSEGGDMGCSSFYEMKEGSWEKDGRPTW